MLVRRRRMVAFNRISLGLLWVETGRRVTAWTDKPECARPVGLLLEVIYPGTSHSRSLDHRRRPLPFRTAMASARRCPTSTTSRLPLVTPV